MTKAINERSALFGVAGALALVTVAVYGQVVTFDFVNYDDTLYVTQNERVQEGLTGENIAWAFTTAETGNWYPLTWLSHMLDVTLFGLNPGGHHAVSVLIHILNTVLLLVLMWRMTGDLWPSAFVAGLFALHPLHVESVAWIAERKDVLSTFFWFAATLAYVEYAREKSTAKYAALVALFALGLMSKSMLVTLPFTLLLFDYWPLKRVEENGWVSLVKEKAPLFAITGAFAIVTYVVKESGGLVQSDAFALPIRIQNAFLSYEAYIADALLPVGNLAVFYMHPGEGISTVSAIAAAILLTAATVVFCALRSRAPHVVVGWLFFLGTLVPVIGLVQVGSQAMADRYTYLPLLGLFVMIAYSYRRATSRLKATAAIVMLACVAVSSFFQVGYWKNSETLFQHALVVAEPSPIAHGNLAKHYDDAGDVESARSHYEEALAISPTFLVSLNNLGLLAYKDGDSDTAEEYFKRTIEAHPTYAPGHRNLAAVYRDTGRDAEADAALRTAIRHNPGYTNAQDLLAASLLRQNQYREASALLEAVVEAQPENAPALANLGVALSQTGKGAQAVQYFERAVAIDPTLVQAQFNLGSIRLQQQRFDQAEKNFRAVLESMPESADARLNLAVCFANLGRVSEARVEVEQVLELNPEHPAARDFLEQLTKRGTR